MKVWNVDSPRAITEHNSAPDCNVIPAYLAMRVTASSRILSEKSGCRAFTSFSVHCALEKMGGLDCGMKLRVATVDHHDTAFRGTVHAYASSMRV